MHRIPREYRERREEGDRRIVSDEDVIDNRLIDDSIYLEDIIHFPKKIYAKKEEEDINILSLSKFKEMNINKLKEDIFYYCSSPECLEKFRQSLDEDKNYEFYQNLDSKNFLYSQKQKTDILLDKNIKLKSLVKPKKLSDYKEELCVKLSEANNGGNIVEKKKQIKNANLILNKIEDILMIYKDKNETEIIEQLNELDKIIKDSKIQMKYLGFVLFNSIQNNLYTLLSLILDKIDKNEKNESILTAFGNIFKEIIENFKSIKLLFLFIKFCSLHQNILESIKIDTNKPNQFICEDSFNCKKLYDDSNFKNKISINFNQLVKNKELIDKMKNNNFIDLCNYNTIIKDDILFVFFSYPKKKNEIKKEEAKADEEKMEEVEVEEENPEEENPEEEKVEGEKDKEINEDENILFFIKIKFLDKRVIDS
jgi:hypothetical protein